MKRSGLSDGGERLECTVSYYDYGVVSIEFDLPFEFDWPALVNLSATSMLAPHVEKKAAEVVRSCQED